MTLLLPHQLNFSSRVLHSVQRYFTDDPLRPTLNGNNCSAGTPASYNAQHAIPTVHSFPAYIPSAAGRLIATGQQHHNGNFTARPYVGGGYSSPQPYLQQQHYSPQNSLTPSPLQRPRYGGNASSLQPVFGGHASQRVAQYQSHPTSPVRHRLQASQSGHALCQSTPTLHSSLPSAVSRPFSIQETDSIKKQQRIGLLSTPSSTVRQPLATRSNNIQKPRPKYSPESAHKRPTHLPLAAGQYLGYYDFEEKYKIYHHKKFSDGAKFRKKRREWLAQLDLDVLPYRNIVSFSIHSQITSSLKYH